MTRRLRALAIAALVLAACSVLSGTYSYYFTDGLTSINTSNWTQNGTLTAGSGGLTSSNADGGSLISNVAVPDGTSNYEVKTTLTLTQSGGTYVTYLRATSTAESGPLPTGTSYAFEVQNPTFSGSGCSATLAAFKFINGAPTVLSATTITCHNGVTVRVVYLGANNQMVVYVDNLDVMWVPDGSITSGQPGIGVRAAPAGNSIAQVQMATLYTGAPVMPPVTEIGVTAFANRVEMQWPGAAEPNGPGVAFYFVSRNGSQIGWQEYTQRFEDPSVSPSTTYNYSIQAYDFDFNVSAPSSFTVVTPPAGAIDAREVGIRPNGAYWGGAGEQIDLRSGNLNYTMPLIKAMGRGGWSVGISLSYNSQNWRWDPGGMWQLGEDVGYGYGWKLQAGSLLVLELVNNTTGEYLFTDATGAQYHLNQNNGGVWTSTESIYVSYDSNTGKLHFNDGSFWVMGCTSAGTEWDAGTQYPTLMEDSNGNEVVITYNSGVGATWNNSSSRISTILDVRGNVYYPDYTFTYNTDAIPHLTGIANTIGTPESYSFGYTENYGLTSPLTGQSYGSVTLLQSAQVYSVPAGYAMQPPTYFSYDTGAATSSCNGVGTGSSGAGELTQVTTPYCGHLRWGYTTYTLSGSRQYREILSRYLSLSSGAAETLITLSRANDSGYSVHSSATLDDAPANAEKYWSFQTDTTQFNGGLQLTYEERTFSTHTALSHLDFTWAQTATTLNPYIGTTVTKIDPMQWYEVDKQTSQALDQYGNLIQMLAYNFGAGSVGSLARTYTNWYLTGTNYAPLYIFNRLTESTVTDGTNTATLVLNTYDGSTITSVTGLQEHDNANYPASFVYRGNITSSTTLTATTTNSYDMGGNVTATTVNGVASSINTNSSTNYAAPSAITTNNALTSTMNWSGFLGLTSAAGPNGDGGTVSYDYYARPQSSTSPYGAVTNYGYSGSSLPPFKTANTNSDFTTTVMDGFGRPLQTTTGYGSTTVSVVDTAYAPCGCSPLGKLSQQSQPYAPGGTDVWTTYQYDASGRTTRVTLPDGSFTSYVYEGASVIATDPAGNVKTFGMDAFGNLGIVLETDPNPALGTVTTSYAYDLLNHLTVVYMLRGNVAQERLFNYTTNNTVGAYLLSATNPENGTVTYTYSGNLLASKTDAKGQQLTYQYDGYNRLKSVTWANAYPSAQVLRTYYYDTNPSFSGSFSQNALGRLTAVQYPSQGGVQMNDMYSYVPFNAPGAGLAAAKRLQVNQTISYYIDNQNDTSTQPMTVNLDTNYSYNNEGGITSLSYPSTQSLGTPTAGPTYNYTYDSMYRLNGMTSAGNTVVANVSYNVANQLLTMYYGYNETRAYNTLGQLTGLNVQGPYGTVESLTYNYPTGSNNGKISSMYNAVSGETVIYTYDSLNRLATAAGSGWGDSYTYDGFGNLLQKNVTAGSAPSMNISVNQANNQIEGVYGVSYDANGNQNDGAYDVENRPINDGIQQYAYDAQNRRIWSWPDMGGRDTLGNATGYTVNMYSASGQKLGAYTFQPTTWEHGGFYTPVIQVTLSSSDAYFGSRRLAVLDQLGSAAPTPGGLSATFYPWGEFRGSTNPQNTWSFATYWRDSSTGLDYANNRYYSSQYGRFMTPDPYRGTSGGPGDPNKPQSWNKYAYTTGDPVNWIDPQGLFQQGPSLMNTPPVISWPQQPGGGWGTSQYWASAINSAIQNATQQAVTLSETAFIQQAVQSASSLLTSQNCAGLFLTPSQNTATNRNLLSNELAQDVGSFMLMSGALASSANIPANVPAFTVGGSTWIVEGGAFFTGQAQTSSGAYAPLGGWAQGLGLTAFDQTTIIHEFMHQVGIVGQDTPGANGVTPTYTLPNGDTVTGSAAISSEVVKNCL